MERTTVTMRRNPERGVILQSTKGTALAGIGIQQLLAQRLQSNAGGLSHKGSVRSDGDTSGFEPHHSLSIRPCAALRSDDEDWTVNGIQFHQIWQAALLELHCRNRADCRNEFARRYFDAPSFQLCDRFRNGEHVLERRMPSRPITDKNDVIVCV